ncbi:hypothetical protein FUSNEC_GEN_294_01450 [Fusobacterium necrophorum subsp. funduliforme]|uniref:hypothetical protein n=1 Tax=Fusobacterium necrophorum TaxID=859 RepID=UPI000A51DE3B|nr:hypothetical protein [Fusobacterium necrophorum]MDK4472399.1 hypothetical protein [Fusobacterium necrophorum]MDK4479170.1 hypothetical protein [Fusobacterium necrophorum]MDK4518960.1 hypothetical protein [Fusobacterium necrophorum]
MKYIFSKEKYIEKEGIIAYEKNKSFVDECDGKRVVFCGFVEDTEYVAKREWCKAVECEEELMKQIITFKSYPNFFEKEKSGLKCNTVRIFELNDDREYILRDIMNEEIKKENVVLEILNAETGETFEREISDVSKFEINNVEIYIISWRHEDDETKA